jgi:hypothetical protein
MSNSLERIFLGMVGDLFVEMLLSSTSVLETPNKSWKLKVPVLIQQEPWKRHAIFEEVPTQLELHCISTNIRSETPSYTLSNMAPVKKNQGKTPKYHQQHEIAPN